MDLAERLREIDRAKDESLSRRQREEAQYGSRRDAYEKGLKEARRIAGNAAANELADWIETTIRNEQRLPRGREIRQEGADICRDLGEPVSTGSWLGA